MSAFTLLIDGERYSGWKTIRVTRGLERAAADFALSVSDREPWPIYTGAACEIYIDDDLLLTGWVDAYRPGCSDTEHRIELTGRSKTCDFVDSSVTIDGGQMNGMTVRQIAELLAEPFDLKVIAEEEGEPVPEVQVQQSETCFKLVEKLARLQELLVTDDADGNIVLTRAGNKESETALVFGSNVKAATADLDDSQRFSDYIIKAQRPGNRTKDDKMARGKKPKGDYWEGSVMSAEAHNADDWRAEWRRRMRAVQQDARDRAQRMDDGGDDPEFENGDENGNGGREPGDGSDTEADRGVSVITEIVGTAKDSGITRYRPKVIVAEAQADDDFAAKRADWELRRRIANAVKASVTVNGWRQDNGELWATNLMVLVNIPWFGLERELITGEVEFAIDESGEITTLSLTLPDAFLPEKVRLPKVKKAKKGKKGKKGKGKVDHWEGSIM